MLLSYKENICRIQLTENSIFDILNITVADSTK